MATLFKRLSLTLLILLIAYVLTVQVLRWIALGEEEREALALMEQPVPVPEGQGGFKYLAFPDTAVPVSELEAALAQDVAAYRAWHAGAGERLGQHANADQSAEVFVSPVANRYPARKAMEVPDGACRLRDADCMDKLRANQAPIRGWLADEADRLALANQAIRSDHLANPYPAGIDSPFAAYRMLGLPLNDITLQSLAGDHAGALERACGLLAASRRFLRHDGLLIDKMVTGALTEGAGGLVLAIRRADPLAPMPEACDTALAPVVASDYLVCNALRAEFAMIATMSRQMDALYAGSWNPADAGMRWLLVDGHLQRGWTARPRAPLCRDENFPAILEGRMPAPDPLAFSMASVDYWAAPISNVLANIGTTSHEQYQQRLLDHAVALRLHLADIAAASGELPAGPSARSAASE